MGRVYTATVLSNAVSVSNDIFFIKAPASNALVIHSAFVGQASDAGDAQAEMKTIRWRRFSVDASGGTSVTPRQHTDFGAAVAFGGTVVHSATLQATNHNVLAETFNVQAGWYYTPTPEERIVVPPSGRLALTIGGTLADALTMTCRMTFETVG